MFSQQDYQQRLLDRGYSNEQVEKLLSILSDSKCIPELIKSSHKIISAAKETHHLSTEDLIKIIEARVRIQYKHQQSTACIHLLEIDQRNTGSLAFANPID